MLSVLPLFVCGQPRGCGEVAAVNQLAAAFAGAGVLLDEAAADEESDLDSTLTAGAESLLAGSLADPEPPRLSVR